MTQHIVYLTRNFLTVMTSV